ncbi:MAG: adenylate/guanylate cyclase domain-containing protein [Candidatus Binatia bacterium]
MTVMFIDLVGSTILSQQLDPEEYHARVVAYQTACQQIVARYDGHIAQYLGDGVLVYFGYPTAHEEDAGRAVRSGLEIVTAVGQLAYTPPLQVRIGIHTGPVVVGEIGAGERTERLALGETPNLAARVQGQAEPDSVVLSAATYRLVHGFFSCESLGPQPLKNVATPIELYRVDSEGDAHTRFEVAVQKGLTPLVGRDTELALLRQRWAQAKAGAGHVVLLSGEPGIGKSRLVQDLKEHVSVEGAPRIEFRCSPYHQNSALYPIIDHLQRLLQFAREDTSAIKLEKLQHTLSRYRFPQAYTVPLLAALLSLPHPEGYPPITLSPQKQKEKTQAALVAWLVEEAERQPVYTTWEDLHWADPSTLEVLTLLVDQVPTTQLLTVLTFRPEFRPPWGNRSHLSQLTLSRLGHTQVETMVARVTGECALPPEVMQQIVAKTDGVPLFVEELTKSVLEAEAVGARHAVPLQSLGIPATLQDALMARLDRLPTAKEIAQLGATLGREFSYELLHAVSPLDEDNLQQGLRQLVEAELLYQRGLPPQVTYLFKHALVQDTAYQSLLKSKRQQLHQTIAQVLEAQFPDTKETQPELLAHHYTEANLIEPAISYWQQAGQRAAQRSANSEAINHLTKGLEVLKTLPATRERAQQELTLQLALGASLLATKGYTVPEVSHAYSRARELCLQIGETPELFSVLTGLYRFYAAQAEHQTAHEVAKQLLALAQKAQEPTLLLGAHYAMGGLYWLGEFVPALAHQQQVSALYRPQQHRPLAFVYGVDFGIIFSAMAFTLWYLGYPDQALKSSDKAIILAQELSHSHSLALVLHYTAWLHQYRREGPATQKRAEEVIALAHEQGFPFLLAWGTMYRGWALAQQGQEEKGIRQIRQGLAASRATGAGVGVPYWLALLAELCGKTGQIEEGFSLLSEALTVVGKTEERFYEAEIYRLKGELTLQSKVESEKSKVDEAEACFLKALEVAQNQQAKSLELRASISLARLWQQQGKQTEAHTLLSAVYNWFTEGFDTKNLQEAKALIEELSH